MNVSMLPFIVPVVALLGAASLQAAPSHPETRQSAHRRDMVRHHEVRRQAIRRHETLRRGIRRRPSPRPGFSAHAFDGYWSVLVVTQQGDCDRAYRWGLGVVDDRITDVGDAIAQVSGSIAPNGRVVARFSRGSDMLTASGSLSGQWGTGTWSSPTRACSGWWRAEKRPRSDAEASTAP